MLDTSILDNIESSITLVDDFLKRVEDEIRAHDIIVDDIKKRNIVIASLEGKIKECEELKKVYINASSAMRDKARQDFEKIVTDALQFVTQDSNCSFVIQESTVRGKPAYEFYVKTIINGEECLRKPEDSNGGGFVDVISITGKVAYWKIFNSPKIMNYCFPMDEPSKMVSEQMSIKFAEYIKFLGKQFGLQILMITHNDSVSSVADKTFAVTQNANGVSEVNLLQDIDGNIIMNDIGEILKGYGEDDGK